MLDGWNVNRSYRGMSAEQRLADRRERLMTAAYTLYAKPGFVATTIERLCSEARISNRAFYECFGGREELLQALHERCVEESLAVVAKALQEAPATLNDRVRAGIRAYIEFATADWRRARIMHLEVRRSGDVLTASRQRAVESFARLVEEASAEFPLPAEPNRRLVALGVIGALQELLIEWLLSDEPPSIDELVGVAVHIFGRSLGSP
ncbi:TetR/AcrR family transcriptional regulator [Nonomuraea aurantiaca]|uniref:TetR/AcrR family transcriptional regulator n=1 Tax=Nonomuraea aurantiaca TaxID=2878562 RepID=UPI001CD9468B|nr:TetR/AcrR family transcriptional regulator [Nonomuraea aurantiaca]MCA2221260.1 TetR/AcrR family transcriptional regulator [Nonomuraea aurantiaca]